MADLPGDTAIFSPSVARSAASTAKEWAYINAWLTTKYNNTRTPPSFERNNSTLQALLALAALNETADEDRELLARVEADALAKLRASAAAGRDEPGCHENDEAATTLSGFKTGFFSALEDCLTRDGKASLDAMAATAVELGMAFPEPAQLGQAVVSVQTRVFDLEQATARANVLQRDIDSEASRLARLLVGLNGDEFRPPPDLARQNLAMQRKVKAMSQKMPEMQGRVSSLARVVGVPSSTIEQVVREEDEYLGLLEVKRTLDHQISEFEGLPPDTEQARQQLDTIRAQLRNITHRRDAVFENLVERGTPRKGR
ncbi:unnamed protein product [Discula destructiva]